MQAQEACEGQPAALGSPASPAGLERGQGEERKETLYEKAERLCRELGEIIAFDEQKREMMKRLVSRCEYLEERLREIEYYIDWAEKLKARWEGKLGVR
jgi:hypothetical protein